MFFILLYQRLNLCFCVHVSESSVAHMVCALVSVLDSGPGGTVSIPDRVTRNKLWQVANFASPRKRYGVNREPDVTFKF